MLILEDYLNTSSLVAWVTVNALHIISTKFNLIIIIIIILIILLKQDYKVQLANNKIQMAWLICWLVVG